MMSCVLRNSGLSSIKFLCATLSHMSIGPWVVVSVSFQEVNHAPHPQTSAQGDHQGLEHFDCAVEKFHRQICRNPCVRFSHVS